MHQAVVGDEIQQTIGGHARADPLEGVHALVTQCDQHDCQAGEHHRVQIVLLEPTGARFVVRAMPAPPPAVHDVFMGQVRDPFHAGQGQHKDQAVD